MADEFKAAEIDRRALIKKAAVGAGVAWAAPAVLASSAGAITVETCYLGKFDTGVGSGTASAGGDNVCSFGAATGGAGTASVAYSNPKPGEPNENLTATVTVPQGCEIRGIALKAGPDHQCFAGNNSTQQSVTVTGNQAISHTDVYYCCPTGSL